MERYYNIHISLTTMLYDRGYDVRGENEMGYSEFLLSYPNYKAMAKIKYESDDSDKSLIYVYYITPEKDSQLGVEKIKFVVSDMEKEEFRKAIIISPRSASHEALNNINLIRGRNNIQVFTESELIFPVAHHILQPKYTLAHEADKLEFLEKYGWDEDQLKVKLPKLLLKNPISKYFDFEPDQLVRIETNDGTRQIRIVVDI